MRFFFKGLRFQNWRSQIFQKKNSFGEKAQKFLQNSFLGFWWKFNLLTCLLYSKMTRSNVVYDSAKTVLLGKIWFSVSPAQNALNQSECRSLWSTTSLGGVNRYLRFLHRDSHKGKVESGTAIFWLSLTSCAFHSSKLQDYLIINISGKNNFHLSFFIWSYSSRESSIRD